MAVTAEAKVLTKRGPVMYTELYLEDECLVRQDDGSLVWSSIPEVVTVYDVMWTLDSPVGSFSQSYDHRFPIIKTNGHGKYDETITTIPKHVERDLLVLGGWKFDETGEFDDGPSARLYALLVAGIATIEKRGSTSSIHIRHNDRVYLKRVLFGIPHHVYYEHMYVITGPIVEQVQHMQSYTDDACIMNMSSYAREEFLDVFFDARPIVIPESVKLAAFFCGYSIRGLRMTKDALSKVEPLWYQQGRQQMYNLMVDKPYTVYMADRYVLTGG